MRVTRQLAAALIVLAGLALHMRPVSAETAQAEDPASERDVVIDYCRNIADKAAEVRAARQMAALKALEAQLDEKTSLLDARRAELEKMLERQRQFQDEAEAGLLEIYAKLQPEAAAKQMANLDIQLASSLLHRLKPRVASQILNEMKPELAASLVKTIATIAEAKPKSE